MWRQWAGDVSLDLVHLSPDFHKLDKHFRPQLDAKFYIFEQKKSQFNIIKSHGFI